MTAKKLLKKALKYSTGLLFIRDSDIILASYPKSGNTWVRFFFCNIISLEDGCGKEVDYELLNSTLPAFGNDLLHHKWCYESVPRVIKTHTKYIAPFTSAKKVLLVRDPRDVMVSYYKFLENKNNINLNLSFKKFIRSSKYGIYAWCNHYVSWRDSYDVLVKYEDLRNDDIYEFEKLLSKLKINFDNDVIRSAAKRSRFERVKKMEKKSKKNANNIKSESNFARKGKVGQWRSLFDKEDIQFSERVLENHDIEVY